MQKPYKRRRKARARRAARKTKASREGRRPGGRRGEGEYNTYAETVQYLREHVMTEEAL